eukprot:12240296-Karenia_brevis.AAC.1
MDALLPIHLLLEAGFEWQSELSVCVASGDILAAFDNLSPQHACRDMVASGLHPQLVAAIARENCDLILQPGFPECPDVEPVPFNKAIRQGGMESPFCWNRSVEQMLSCLAPSWKARGLGVSLSDDYCVTHVVWADNFFLLAASEQAVQTMVIELSAGLMARGLSWKPTSLEI